jgi:hypothetical protein
MGEMRAIRTELKALREAIEALTEQLKQSHASHDQ